jgi:hypothetical protein
MKRFVSSLQSIFIDQKRFRKMVGSIITILVLLWLPACSLANQENVSIQSDSRELGDFSSVVFNAVGEMNIIPGDANSITLVADPQIIDKIQTTIHDNTLYIEFNDNFITSPIDPQLSTKYELTVKTIERITLQGTGNIIVHDLSTNNLTLNLSGVGDISVIDLEAEFLTVNYDGGGQFNISGTATEQDVRINGSGLYDASQLLTRVTSIQLLGSADAAVWVKDNLNATIRGEGVLEYYGAPFLIKNILRSDSLQPKGLK